MIGCINLASWIPKALVEHKITVSNLKRLLFGKGAKTTQKQSPTIAKPDAITDAEKSEASNQAPCEAKKPKGHGRLPHTAYTHAIEMSLVTQLCRKLRIKLMYPILRISGLRKAGFI
ncbi:hypothetical protein BN59_01522 [Legionella massiliensis]|uniref:Uncharacterized protein n=1 Tax=Legionella massiliensis TaxID=1034943 RepID=A0A078KS01_9GAMM|nr:hypothetical protein BN59_01522 [Legionella massiliensis]CEE12978.1 hypothetical protein BN1094_01522 [Legionella massiliensis]